MSVTFTPGDNSFSAQSTSIPAKTETLDVIAAGGVLNLTCLGSGQFCVMKGAV
jgi:hypothetical protein